MFNTFYEDTSVRKKVDEQNEKNIVIIFET